ncbi:hypothetical protein EIN_160400 [Entamoeba invadens IP1]|uniref:Uncharacterized protein n=1 Tax=Entamoeba invadens IP1 TaxID=370355 RepID=A0A0A1TYD4_ENTIV|nr:hypothetical protein EIN_160400 [Entamoeba invadens IP1]ELP86536.1 hypothetical protein EIN_160400 [Entamoeba invadens IP1]|eukprot:XP_004185882.1 hypothetical protein EIN_160400 [Entamoeba invadens IP1]
MECQTLQQQMKLLRSENWLEKVLIKTKAKVLGVSPSTARLNNLYDDVEGKSGRKREINQSRMPLLLETIRERQNTTKPITTKEMGNIVEGVVGKKVLKSTLDVTGAMKELVSAISADNIISNDATKDSNTRAASDQRLKNSLSKILNSLDTSASHEVVIASFRRAGMVSRLTNNRFVFYVDIKSASRLVEEFSAFFQANVFSNVVIARRLSAPHNEIETVSISDLKRERKRAPETSVFVRHINHLTQQIEFSGNLEQSISILKTQIAQYL